MIECVIDEIFKREVTFNQSELPNFDDFEDLLPLSLKDFTKNLSRVFYEHYHRQILNDALSSMWCSVRITTSPIEEREKMDML